VKNCQFDDINIVDNRLKLYIDQQTFKPTILNELLVFLYKTQPNHPFYNSTKII
jgi:hypothetical protein